MKGLICMKKIIEMLLTVVWALAFAWILFTGKITIEQVLAVSVVALVVFGIKCEIEEHRAKKKEEAEKADVTE